MIRSIVLLALFPAVLAAQETYVGMQIGRNAVDLLHHGTRTGLAAGLFTEVDLNDHVGVGWEVTWLRSAVEEPLDPWNSRWPNTADPEYLTTDLVGRLSWRVPAPLPFDLAVGATVVGGGWLGYRTGGSYADAALRRADFGHVWGVAFFAERGRLKVEASARSYHGEREVWDGGPTQRGSPAFIGVAYRIHS
ncbi:MAG: hypothetical protein PVJ02_19640 [Gemmatimonadota bacterium]|jgi:hypothetical protein